MAYSTGEVVATPSEKVPYKVVFKLGETVLSEWPVGSISEGESQIFTVLTSLLEKARAEGYLK